MRFWVLAPASSLPCYIGDPHPKSRKSSKYSLFSLDSGDASFQICAAVWSGFFFSRRC